MDFKQLVTVLRRRWLTIGLLLVLAVGLSSAYTFTRTKVYESTSQVFVSADVRNAQDAYAASLAISSRMATYADLATSVDLLDRVIDQLDLNLDAETLAAKMTSIVVPNTLSVQITVRDPNPTVAQQIDQSVSEQLAAYLEELETPSGTTSPQVSARVTDPASYDAAAVSPKPLLDLVVAGLIGLVLGVGLAVARDVLDRTVRTMEHVEEVTAKPLLASIGFDSSIRKTPLLTDLSAFAPRTEAFRLLRTNLQFLDLDQQPRSLVITSAVPGEGKTSTSTNLALALAQAGRRVLLVDGDLRRPRVAGLLGLDAAVGLTTVLVGSAAMRDAIQVHEPSGLHFLASGARPPNPTEILQSRVTHELIERLTGLYDMVIIDAPPLLPVADAAVLSTIADGSIVIARHGRTTREQLAEAVGRLESVGGRLFGIVMNMIPRRAANDYYYYYYEDVAPRGKGGNRPNVTLPEPGRAPVPAPAPVPVVEVEPEPVPSPTPAPVPEPAPEKVPVAVAVAPVAATPVKAARAPRRPRKVAAAPQPQANH